MCMIPMLKWLSHIIAVFIYLGEVGFVGWLCKLGSSFGKVSGHSYCKNQILSNQVNLPFEHCKNLFCHAFWHAGGLNCKCVAYVKCFVKMKSLAPCQLRTVTVHSLTDHLHVTYFHSIFYPINILWNNFWKILMM